MVYIGTIGKCQAIDRDCSFNQQINSLSPFGETSSRYLLAVCQSEFFQQAAWTASARTTIAILNKGNRELLPFPLPPLAEQHRIVAKVDALMALTATAATRRRLLDALLAEALAPMADRTMQAAE
jgi:type I restriction enzyme S subunit